MEILEGQLCNSVVILKKVLAQGLVVIQKTPFTHFTWGFGTQVELIHRWQEFDNTSFHFSFQFKINPISFLFAFMFKMEVVQSFSIHIQGSKSVRKDEFTDLSLQNVLKWRTKINQRIMYEIGM